MGRRAGTRRPSRSCQVTSQLLERCATGPRRRPPCQAPSTHTSADTAHEAAHAEAAMPACPGHEETTWAPSWSLLWDWATAKGLSAKSGAVPASPRAWQCLGTLTFRSAGNSSFFTSPVAAAMLPAPENAASPSWDACSFAFSATARAGGAHQCPSPVPKGVPSCGFMPCTTRGGAGGEMLGRIRLFPLPCPGGEGRGPRHSSAAGQGV